MVECSGHELFGALVTHRADPSPIIICAEDSPKGLTVFHGWSLFENREINDCIGYCDNPWSEGWSFFCNSITDTRAGDFSSSLFCETIRQLLDILVQLDEVHKAIEQGKAQQSDGEGHS